MPPGDTPFSKAVKYATTASAALAMIEKAESVEEERLLNMANAYSNCSLAWSKIAEITLSPGESYIEPDL